MLSCEYRVKFMYKLMQWSLTDPHASGMIRKVGMYFCTLTTGHLTNGSKQITMVVYCYLNAFHLHSNAFIK